MPKYRKIVRIVWLFAMGSKKGVSRGKYSTRFLQPNEVSCWKCNKKYKRKPILAQHILTKHFGHYIKCPVCNERFSSVSTCHRHLKNIHGISEYKSFHLKLKSDHENALIANSLPTSLDVVAPLSMEENDAFGKHIVAESSIEVGQEVLAAPAFASIEQLISIGSCCFHCGMSPNSNFITCPHCSNVQFCSEKCRLSIVHKSRCNALFNKTDDHVIRLATQLILVALKSVDNIEAMLQFCRGILFSNKKSHNCRPIFAKYGEILQLKGKSDQYHFSIANRICNYVKLSIPLRYFETHRRIIYHMAARHAVSIELNSFCEEFRVSKGGLCRRYSIFDAISRINHSCVPNVHHYIDENNVMNCIAVRPIKAGDQIFINYLSGSEEDDTAKRQNNIKTKWEFDCRCDKCKQHATIDEFSFTSTDPSFQIIKKNFANRSLSNVNSIRQECIKYIKKFGHSWSTSLDYVVCCLIKIINEF